MLNKGLHKIWLSIFLLAIYIQVNVAGEFLHDIYHLVSSEVVSHQHQFGDLPEWQKISSALKLSAAPEDSNGSCPFLKLLQSSKSIHFGANEFRRDFEKNLSASSDGLLICFESILNPNASPRAPPAGLAS